MIVWFIVICYVIGYVSMWRSVVWMIIMDVTSGHESYIENDTIAFGALLGSFFTLFWPIIFPFVAIKWIANRLAKRKQQDTLAFLINMVKPRHLKNESAS